LRTCEAIYIHIRGRIPQHGVYNITGTLIYQSAAASDKAEIALSGRSIYIIRSDDKVIKIVN
jgi:hypothetical protein